MVKVVYDCWYGNKYFYFYCWFFLIFLKYIVGLFILLLFLFCVLGFFFFCYVLYVSKCVVDIEVDVILLFYIKIVRKYLLYKNISFEFDKMIDFCFVYGNFLNFLYIISGYILFL